MVKPRKKLEIDLGWLKPWFDLTVDERKLLGAILVLAVIGLTARYVHAKRQKPEQTEPGRIAQADWRGTR